MMIEAGYRSPLQQMAETTATDLWNDSCSQSELRYALEHGACGATTNPTIVSAVLQQDFDEWRPVLHNLIRDRAQASAVEIAWALNEQMAVAGAKLLQPIFEKSQRKKGFISIQTNAQLYRSSAELLKQARHFRTLADNIMVKMPVTQAGVAAIEEAIYLGVNINATVCFSVAQSLAVAEAVERALKRRQQQGLDNADLHPVCTIMVGRVDDWLKVIAEQEQLIVTPGLLEWAGVAVFKHAYQLYRERGYRCRLLAAAYRNHYHWSEFIGGDVVLTIPCAWQRRFNRSDVTVENRINNPVDAALIAELKAKFPDFVRAYEADGMQVKEFDDYGATRRTLRGFLQGYEKLIAMVVDEMIPNPDKKGGGR